jgi:choline-sulfatase
MRSREFLKGMGVSFMLQPKSVESVQGASGVETQTPVMMQTPDERARPNILLIEVDQMRWDAINDRSLCRTPNINQLIREGLNFERAYTAAALCAPSRAMLTSGTFQWRNGVFNQTHSAPTVNPDPFPETVLFSQRLRAVGYRQGFVGKWDVSMMRTPLDFGYDEIADPILYGRSTLEGLETNPDRVPAPPPGYARNGDRALDAGRFYWPGTTEPFVMWGHYDIPEENTPTYHTAECGIRMMKRLAKQPGPWHMQIQILEPHDPYLPVKKYLDRYRAEEIPVPKSFYDAFAGKPELHAREASTWGECTEAIYREGRRHYYAFCEMVDAQIGRILNALEETGQKDNTLLVFTTDHGDMLGAHHMWSKDWMPYEDTYRVPLVVRWPGHTRPGTNTSKLVHLHDLAYTFVEAAGAPAMPFADGRSLLPLFEDKAPADWPDHILNVWYGGEFFRQLHMVVTDRYKFMFNSFAFDELYDLHADPEEMTNLIDDPGHAAVCDDMRARCYELMAQFGSPYGYPSPNFHRKDYGLPNRYGAPRYLPRGKRMQVTSA